MHRNNGQGLLKVRINLFTKKIICLGRDYPPCPAQWGIYDGSRHTVKLLSIELYFVHKARKNTCSEFRRASVILFIDSRGRSNSTQQKVPNPSCPKNSVTGWKEEKSPIPSIWPHCSWIRLFSRNASESLLWTKTSASFLRIKQVVVSRCLRWGFLGVSDVGSAVRVFTRQITSLGKAKALRDLLEYKDLNQSEQTHYPGLHTLVPKPGGIVWLRTSPITTLNLSFLIWKVGVMWA